MEKRRHSHAGYRYPIGSMGCIYFSLVFFFLLHRTASTSVQTPFLPENFRPTQSGYLPVNSSSTSAIFFAFYEAQNLIFSFSETPLLLWLQGGPGCSSMVGNFYELGPWIVTSDPSGDKNFTVRSNPGAWNRIFGLLFFDNPIGTGFSTVSSPEEIPRDQTTVAKHLFFALQSFLSRNPSFRSRPIYITGESYAGKYVPSIGYYILQQNTVSLKQRKLNLQGVAIGNGLTDPINQVTTHASTAFYSGLIDEKQRNHIEKLQNEAVRSIQEKKWKDAAEARNEALNYLQNVTGLATLYDLRRKRPYDTKLVSVLLENNEVKKALNVEETKVFLECSKDVGSALHEDIMKSVRFMVEDLLKKTRVLLYQGQFDLRDGVVSTEAWIKKMEWDGLQKFLLAERKVWRVNNEHAGYIQRWGNLSEVVVAGAGHLVPSDQGVNAQAMIEDWISKKGLFSDNVNGISNLPEFL